MTPIAPTIRHYALAAAFGVVAACSSAPAQDAPAANKPLEQRVRELEATLRKMEAQRTVTVGADGVASLPPTVIGAAPAEPPPAFFLPDPPKEAKAPKPLAGWDDGFILRSADDHFKLKITGQVQADYRHYQNDTDTGDINTFLVRRARLGIEATVWENYELRLLPEFGQGNPRIVDSFVNVHYWDEFQFEAGKFKQAFSLEHLIQDRFVPTIERSIIDQLGPQRDVGVMIHGQKLCDDRLDYAFTVYNGTQGGDVDNDQHKEMSGRIAVRPFKTAAGDGLFDKLQFGLGATDGNDNGVLFPAVYRTPLGVPFFQYAAGARPDGTRWRVSPELAYIYGPMSLSAQYYHDSQQTRIAFDKVLGAAKSRVVANGFFVMGTLILSGEERTSLSQTIDPLRPFDPRCGGGGAFELVSRVSHVEFGDDDNPAAFAKLINRERTSRAATEITNGFNWYLNKFVRLQFNWEHARFGDPIRLGGAGRAGRLDHQNTFSTRFQVVF